VDWNKRPGNASAVSKELFSASLYLEASSLLDGARVGLERWSFRQAITFAKTGRAAQAGGLGSPGRLAPCIGGPFIVKPLEKCHRQRGPSG